MAHAEDSARGDPLTIDWHELTERSARLDVTRCEYAHFYRDDLDTPDIGHLVVCENDDWFVAGLGDVTFERHHTIMQGADHCDFCYRLETQPTDGAITRQVCRFNTRSSVVMSASDQVLKALDLAASEVTVNLRQAHDLGRHVPGLAWTVRELGAHLVSVTRAYTAAECDVQPVGPDLRAVAENNRRLLDTTEFTTSEHLASAFASAARNFVDVNRDLERDQYVPFYGDLKITAAAAGRLMLYEFLVHNHDLARTLTRNHRVDPDRARIALEAFREVLPLFVRPEPTRRLHTTYELHIRGSDPYLLRFEHGTLTIEPTAHPHEAICHINAEPAAYLLVAAGRRSQWHAIATGKLLAYGRQPWNALRFKSLFITV